MVVFGLNFCAIKKIEKTQTGITYAIIVILYQGIYPVCGRDFAIIQARIQESNAKMTKTTVLRHDIYCARCVKSSNRNHKSRNHRFMDGISRYYERYLRTEEYKNRKKKQESSFQGRTRFRAGIQKKLFAELKPELTKSYRAIESRGMQK